MSKFVVKADSVEKKSALAALAVFILSECIFFILSVCLRGQTLQVVNSAKAVTTILVKWLPVLLIVYKLEKGSAKSLGLTLERQLFIPYTITFVICVITPAFFIGFNRFLLVEFIEQIVYIGLLEEFFYRGYLMSKLCSWLGMEMGLLGSSLLFGLGHVISRMGDHGFGVLNRALVTGGEAFLGGIIFGLIYLKTRNIWPGAILHVSMNMYLGHLIALIGACFSPGTNVFDRYILY